jgi:predicted helicase
MAEWVLLPRTLRFKLVDRLRAACSYRHRGARGRPAHFGWHFGTGLVGGRLADWPTVSKGDPDAWLYFYEEFLAVYDNALRKQTGSYYTPVEVVKPMTRMVDEALRSRFGLADGLANPVVTLVDPAMGTGTFLLEVLRSLATTVSEDQGEGAAGGAVEAALSRIIGFEIQLGPFAVAQLRLLAEVAQLGGGVVPVDGLQTYVTNTLDNPYVEDETLGTFHEPIARSRREANKIKKDRPVMVVIGNPPYRERSHGQGAQWPCF